MSSTSTLIFDDDGYLARGQIRYSVDDIEVRDPWRVTLTDVLDVGPRRLNEHLDGLCDWFFAEGNGDPTRRLWVRGRYGCSWHDDDDLDVVLHYDGTTLPATDTWLLRILGGKPDLHPGRIVVTALDTTWPNYPQLVDQEARRSENSATDPVTLEPHLAGWIEIDEGRQR